MTPFSSFSAAVTVIESDGRKRLHIEDDAAYRSFVSELPAGGCYTLTVEEEKEHRGKTWEQVKYWKGCVCPLVAEHCGLTDKQADLVLLGEKYGYIAAPHGLQIPSVTTIADHSVEEMTALIDWALDWVPAELEIILPPPDKNWKQLLADDRRRKVSREIDRRSA